MWRALEKTPNLRLGAADPQTILLDFSVSDMSEDGVDLNTCLRMQQEEFEVLEVGVFS